MNGRGTVRGTAGAKPEKTQAHLAVSREIDYKEHQMVGMNDKSSLAWREENEYFGKGKKTENTEIIPNE